MPLNKDMARIEGKLDALLDKMNVKYEEPTPKAAAPRKLSEAEQQAIDNAPKTPVGANGPAQGPRVTSQNAPVTPAASPHGMGGRVPSDAVGTVTVETEQPSGKVDVQTMPASDAKGKSKAKPQVNWNS